MPGLRLIRSGHAIKQPVLMLAAAGLLAAACTAASAPAGPGSTMSMPSDMRTAANPSAGTWPEIVRKAPMEVQEAYHFAVANYATLRFIPCYCGCAAQGHRDNFDCYVSQIKPGGWLVLETHAVG